MGFFGKKEKEKEEEPCHRHACVIQRCLVKNDFVPDKCARPIIALRSCCEEHSYKSTHCASLSGLIDIINKKNKSIINKTAAGTTTTQKASAETKQQQQK
ncbi:hypothetical protein CBR_g44919 [Chara braunii]|uniref:Uncharacterized protein n=1 Tax=Chara braunii TaxID=69332 RepID=A0A388LXY2_CHABU|nr:hypothetical protein CBR_g44919 [Chara braunii]|eukprot:GBG87184.1 hypothetical protein CBR_g44919 [Chara braunii]